RSASSLAAVALVMAELILSAFPRNHGGNFFANSHTSTAATIPKLIHLKISLARSVAALPPSSAALALNATQKKRSNKLVTICNRWFCLIGPHSQGCRDASAFAGCAAQFRRKVVRR